MLTTVHHSEPILASKFEKKIKKKIFLEKKNFGKRKKHEKPYPAGMGHSLHSTSDGKDYLVWWCL